MTTATTITRKADSTWKGDVKGGYGLLNTESGALSKSRFSLGTRAGEDETPQTNPEELMAASVASCFSMALSKTLTDNETVPSQLVVTGSVEMEVDDGIKLTKLIIDAEGIVPALDEPGFDEAVKTTAKNCPVLQTLEGGFYEVVVNSKLRQ